MNDPSGGINPLILAYEAGITARRQREQDKLEREKFAEDTRQFNENLKVRLKQHELNQAAQLANEKAARQILADKYRAQFSAGELEPEGFMAPGLPQYSPNLNLPQGSVPYDIPVGTQQTPIASNQPYSDQVVESELGPLTLKNVVPYETAKRRQLDLATVLAEIEAKKKAFEVLTTEGIKSKNALALQEERDKAAAQRNLDTIESRENIAKWNNAARIAAASKRAATKITDADTESLGNTAYLASVGEADITGISDKANVMRNTLSKMGRVQFTTEQRNKLTALSQMNGLFDDLYDFQKSLSNAWGVSKVKSFVPGTEIYAKLASIKQKAARWLELYGDKGMKSDKDIARTIEAIGNTWLTPQQMATQIQKLERDRTYSVLNYHLANVPWHQRLEILLRNNFDPNKYNRIIKRKNGDTVPIFRQDPTSGDWKVYYPETDKWGKP